MDIVTRCRLAAEDLHVMCPSSDSSFTASLAADEIECLRAELEFAEKSRDEWCKAVGTIAVVVPDKDVLLAGGTVHTLAAYFREALRERDALRQDAELWREIARRFDQTTTSAAMRVIYDLGLAGSPSLPFADIVGAAMAAEKDDK